MEMILIFKITNVGDFPHLWLYTVTLLSPIKTIS